jgi:DGQHR domain-containing protein
VISEEFVHGRYGSAIDLGPCLVGRNLNLNVVRGYAPLDVLATCSQADEQDEVLNREGTQRPLDSKRAKETFQYAMDAMDATAEELPSCFPDVILNVRDIDSVEFYDLESRKSLVEITSVGDEPSHPVVGVRVLLDHLEFPPPEYSPQISRVDGNHRLSATENVLRELAEEDPTGEQSQDFQFPSTAFTLLVKLSNVQEARVFRDINGKQKKVQTDHLVGIELRISSEEELKGDPEKWPLWLSRELTSEGYAFHGMVSFGGSKKGLKQRGKLPPLNINTLLGTMQKLIKNAPRTDVFTRERVDLGPDMLLELANNYWSAVSEVFHEAWSDKKNYIMFTTIGLTGFAKVGGMLIDQLVSDEDTSKENFSRQLKTIRDQLERDGKSFKKDDWVGVAGAGGGDEVARTLVKALEAGDPGFVKLAEDVREKQTVADQVASANSHTESPGTSN